MSSVKEAKEAIQQELLERKRQCMQALMDVSRKYNCAIVPIISIVGGQIQPSIDVVPQPAKDEESVPEPEA